MMPGIGTLTLALALAPALAIVLILLIRRARAAEALNLAASAVSLLAILMILASRNESGLTFWGSYVIIDGLGTWTILCAAIVYFLASLYAVGYMRLLDQEDRLYRFYAMFAGLRAQHAYRPDDEQCRSLLDRNRTDDADQHLPGRVRARGGEHRSCVEVHHRRVGRHQPRPIGHCPVLLERHVRPRANLRHDLAGFAGGRAPAQSRAGVAGLSSRADRLRHQGRSGADAYLAAGRAQRRPGAGVRAPVGRASQHGHGRHRALPRGRRRGRDLDVGARHATGAGRVFAVRRGPIHRPSDGAQAPHGLFERRAHGGYRARLRLRRPARHRGRALPHAQSLAQQIRDVFRRGRRHADLPHEAHSQHPPSAEAAADARRSCGLPGLSPLPGRRRSRCS